MTPAERTLRLRGRGLDWKVLEDETVVLDLQSSRYLSINRSGTALWPLLAEGATMAQLDRKAHERVRRVRVSRDTRCRRVLRQPRGRGPAGGLTFTGGPGGG